jgi:putative DNA primase/helicase
MSRIAQNGRAGNSAPATHDHAGTPWRRHAEALADWTLARVVVRRDVYGTYYEAGGQFQQMTAHAPLTRDVLIRHYRGEVTIGAHLISPENLCTSVAADIDAHNDSANPERNWRCALTTAEHLAGYGLRPLVLDSNGRGGYHGRAFFKKPIAAAVAWWLGAQLRDTLEAAGFPPVEFFPKQGGVTLTTPYGNFDLPFPDPSQLPPESA